MMIRSFVPAIVLHAFLFLLPCPAAEFQYTLEHSANVSIAIYDAKTGELLRTLQTGAQRAAGEHFQRWDGLDRLGRPVPPGAYTWRVLESQGLKAEYLMTLGTSPGWASWDFWPGNHAGVTSVAVAGAGVVMASGTSEGPPVFVHTSLDGKTLKWKRIGLEAWQGAMAMTPAPGATTASGVADIFYVLQNNGVVWKQRLDDHWVGGGGARFNLAWPKDGEKFDPTGYAAQRVDIVAVSGDVLVASYRDRDAVRWIDTSFDPSVKEPVNEFGGGPPPLTPKILAEASIPEPAGVAVSSDGAVLVSSRGRVFRLTRDDPTPRLLIDGLSAPGRIDVDPKSGEILLFDGGNSQQVKRYSRDGKLLKLYGRAGGRNAEGLYQPDSFRDVYDIAHDGEGGFFITEPDSAPRRVARFDAAGTLLDERYGGQMFCTSVDFDPRDPTSVWMQSHWGWLMRVQIDYASRSWRVVETYRYDNKAGGLLDAMGGTTWRVRYQGDRRYLLREGPGTPIVLWHDEQQHRLVPMVIADMNIAGGGYARLPERVKAFLDNDTKTKFNAYLWTDANSDGEPQREEFQWFEGGGWYFDCSVQDGLVYTTRMSFGPNNMHSKLVRLAPTAFTAAGVPIYGTYPHPTDFRALPEDVVHVSAVVNGVSWADADGSAYYAANANSIDGHGTIWPAWVGDIKLLKWDADGRLRWAVGRHATTALQEPTPTGEMHQPTRILGTHRGSLLVAERVVTPMSAWDAHGLYIGRLFDRRADDGLPDEVYTWFQVKGKQSPNYAILNYDMLFGGAAASVGEDLYFIGSGWNCSPVYKVTGWESLRRQEGTVELKEVAPAASGTGSGMVAAFFGNRTLNGDPAFVLESQPATHHWPAGASPDASKLKTGEFSMRLEGQVEIPFSEAFRFSTKNNGGVRVWLDDRLIIDDWRDYDGTSLPYTAERYRVSVSEPIELRAGQRCRVRMEFYQSPAFKELPHEARLQFSWESATLSRQAVPTRYLYSTVPGATKEAMR